MRSPLGLIEDVPVGIHACLVHLILGDEVVAHFVGRIAEHEEDLLCALGHSAQADGEAVARKYRENDAEFAAWDLGFDVVSDVLGGGVIALSPCND